jgi:putative methionine-R-sulfoxide reductase with GAF domain
MVSAVEKEIVSEEKDKPVFDEQTLAKLLEAAYVLQEHNSKLQGIDLGLELKRDQIQAAERSAPAPDAPKPRETEPVAHTDYTLTLAKIVETQHQIQVRHLNLESAMSLVAERLVQSASAGGAAIGMLDGTKLRYRAAFGTLTPAAGTDIPMDKALCVACLSTGQVFRCAKVNRDLPVDTEECRRRGIQSMIAVPVFRDGGVAGGIEIYYPAPQAFTEPDVHTCQLMAGLITEALARDEEVTWKKSLATERAAMLEALERLKPNLAALIDAPAVKPSGPKAGPPATASTSTFDCRKCGHTLLGEEQFCGNCGTPRSSDYEPPSMQSKVATLWQMRETTKKIAPTDPANGGDIPQKSSANLEPAHEESSSLADTLEEQMPGLFAAPGLPTENETEPAESRAPITAEFEDSVLSDLEIPLTPSTEREEAPAAEEEEKTPVSETTALAKPERTTAWSSAASAREFLEKLAPAQRSGTLAQFWTNQRGDIYLAIAVLLLGAVIRWGIWSKHSVSATGHTTQAATAAHRKPVAPDANLSMFDRMLISLGLAEAPPSPVNKGNPDTPVWVDLHTALYYCPGDDLYGKTAKGKITSQRDAQLDQFEPAYRKTCD